MKTGQHNRSTKTVAYTLLAATFVSMFFIDSYTPMRVFVFIWLLFACPMLVVTMLGARLLISKTRPVVMFVLVPVSVVGFGITLITLSLVPQIGPHGDMAGFFYIGAFYFGIWGSALFGLFYAIILFIKKKQLLKTRKPF